MASLPYVEVLDKRTALDACLLYWPVIVLVSVHLLPWELRRELVLSYTDPTLLTAYTSHFVHLTRRHLLVNLVGYTLVATSGYLLYRLAGARRCFRRAAIALPIVLPFTLSALNLVFIRPHIGFGFSGVVMGYYGVLPLALFRYMESVFDWTIRIRDAPFLFFAGITATALNVGTLTGITAMIAAVAGVITFGYAYSIASKIENVTERVMSFDVPGEPGQAETVLAGLTVFLLFPLVAFPSQPAGDGSILNIYTHLLGYCLAFMAAFSTWRTMKWRRSTDTESVSN